MMIVTTQQGILHAIVPLLPARSPLVQCLRAYQRIRMMIGLHCITDTQLDRLKTYIAAYEKACNVRLPLLLPILSNH